MKMSSRARLALVAVALLGSALLLWPKNEVAPQPPVAAGPSLDDALATGRGKEFFQHLNRSVPAEAKASLSAQVDQLMATGKPVDALEAFKLLEACQGMTMLERQNSELPLAGPDFTAKEACGDITQVQLRQREDLLAKAVSARVPGALTEKFMYGPLQHNLHPLSNNPDDPYVKEWKKTFYGELVENAEQAGSYEAMELLTKFNSQGTLGEKNEVQALTYHLARIEVAKTSTERKLQDRVATLISYTEKFSRGLSPEQIAAANAAAQNVLAKCCKR